MHELLDAALHVFAEKGYRNARLDDVADAAGVTKGAIYHYFDTKEGLLLQVVEHYRALAFGRVEDALRDNKLPVATRIRLVVRKVFAQRDSRGGVELLSLLIRGLAHEVPRVHERWLREGPARLWAVLSALVDEGKRRGEFRPDADGDVGARVLVSGLMLQLMWLQHGAAVPELVVDDDRLIDSSVELYLASLRASKAGRAG
jgi:AcrR family transcriptional regulator